MSFWKIASTVAKGVGTAVNDHLERRRAIREKLELKDDVELMNIEINGSTLERAVAKQILRERGM